MPNPLTLAAGELVGVPVAVLRVETDQPEELGHTDGLGCEAMHARQ